MIHFFTADAEACVRYWLSSGSQLVVGEWRTNAGRALLYADLVCFKQVLVGRGACYCALGIIEIHWSIQ